MTKVEFKKASGSLSEYAEKPRKGLIIVVKRGKPFAAVISIRNGDEERYRSGVLPAKYVISSF